MQHVAIEDPSGVGQARRLAVAAGARIGFDVVRSGQLAIVASEIATNVLKHAGTGALLIGEADHHVDLLALDRGPGMADIRACLEDGRSSAGTLGNGLGAVRRQSQGLEILSAPGDGTVLFARVLRQDVSDHGADTIGAVAVAMPGEEVCGDGWAAHDDAQGRTVIVVDGLGHGTEAAVAASEAIREFRRSVDAPPAQLLQAVHQAMRHTRGGAVAVARIDWSSGTLAYAGLGNIAGAIVAADGQVRRLVSHNGTAGHVARKIQTFDYPCGDGLLVMHSDGIGSNWSLAGLAGSRDRHPMVLAARIYRDALRGRDDATVVVTRTAAP
jgi:anti-sigma regulatory factor (Ser/Thr protein kinase)